MQAECEFNASAVSHQSVGRPSRVGQALRASPLGIAVVAAAACGAVRRHVLKLVGVHAEAHGELGDHHRRQRHLCVCAQYWCFQGGRRRRQGRAWVGGGAAGGGPTPPVPTSSRAASAGAQPPAGHASSANSQAQHRPSHARHPPCARPTWPRPSRPRRSRAPRTWRAGWRGTCGSAAATPGGPRWRPGGWARRRSPTGTPRAPRPCAAGGECRGEGGGPQRWAAASSARLAPARGAASPARGTPTHLPCCAAPRPRSRPAARTSYERR